MSDTPRTDAAEELARPLCRDPFPNLQKYVRADFARELECENAALRADNAATQKLLLEEQRKATFLEKENFALRSSRDRMDWEKLSFENAALRADRNRLDWLLSYNGGTWLYWAIDGGQWTPEVGASRAAIDAARKEAT